MPNYKVYPYHHTKVNDEDPMGTVREMIDTKLFSRYVCVAHDLINGVDCCEKEVVYSNCEYYPITITPPHVFCYILLNEEEGSILVNGYDTVPKSYIFESLDVAKRVWERWNNVSEKNLPSTPEIRSLIVLAFERPNTALVNIETLRTTSNFNGVVVGDNYEAKYQLVKFLDGTLDSTDDNGIEKWVLPKTGNVLYLGSADNFPFGKIRSNMVFTTKLSAA